MLTYHGGGGEKFFEKHHKLVHHYLTRTNDNIVLSGFLAGVFDKHQLPYSIIPNIIELDESSFRLRETLRANYICTRAHETLYNIPCILRAFQKTLTKLPEASLTLVGDGSQHAALVQMVNDMELRNVTFTGRVDNQKIYHYLNLSDIFLSSPTVDNMPVSVLEAMNAGLLVISSCVGGVPYMIKDGETGLLFENDNSDQLAKKMIEAVENQATVNDIIIRAHNEVKRYRWDSVKEQLYTAYGFSS